MINPLTSLPSTPAAIAAAISQPNSHFHNLVQDHAAKHAKLKAESKDAAAGLVAHALLLPMLKQLRRSTFNSDGPFSPGKAEKAFGPEFDMQLADRLARSPRMAVTTVMADRLLKRHTQPLASENLDVHG